MNVQNQYYLFQTTSFSWQAPFLDIIIPDTMQGYKFEALSFKPNQVRVFTYYKLRHQGEQSSIAFSLNGRAFKTCPTCVLSYPMPFRRSPNSSFNCCILLV